MPETATVPAPSRSFEKALDTLDLEPVARKLKDADHGAGWSEERTKRAVKNYRVFLLLNHLYPEQPIVPPENVDAVWHHHILDTSKYRRDCEELFGEMLDHHPYFGMGGSAEERRLEETYQKSLQLFERHGADISEAERADCADSCRDGP